MHLTDWLPGRLGGGGSTIHFATWRISSWQPLLSEADRSVVTRVLRTRRVQGAELLAFVVMDDHVHALVRCAGPSVQHVLDLWKSYSAHGLRESHGRSGDVWQRDTFHRQVQDDGDLRERAAYIAANPWKRWPFGGKYPFVWEASRGLGAWQGGRPTVMSSITSLVLGVAKAR